MYKVIIEKSARRDLRKLHGTPHYKKARRAIKQMRNDPFYGHVKKLTEHEVADYRRRIGDYRILFDIDFNKEEVYITHIWHRGKDYKK